MQTLGLRVVKKTDRPEYKVSFLLDLSNPLKAGDISYLSFLTY